MATRRAKTETELASITNEQPEELEEYDSPEALVDAVAPSYTNWAPATVPGFPREYVIYFWGARGSSKTLQLAKMCILGLAQGIPVFTNLELYPEKAGLTAKPNDVGLEFLLSFDESLMDAFIAISEIDTWFDQMRQTSTGNRLGGKFLQQMRKKGLRIGFDTQDYLPGNLMRQVDKLVIGHDFVFSQWGKERNLPEGTTFWYDCWDYSGRMTGWKGNHWQEALYHAERVWPLFNTYKIHDPLEFARKVKITGGEMEKNVDTGEMYLASEKTQRQWDDNRKANHVVLETIIPTYQATGLFDLVAEYHGIEDAGDRYVFSTKQVSIALSRVPPQDRALLLSTWEKIKALAKQGTLGAIGQGGHRIELAKPMEAISEN